jgi:predicted nuclease of restriction endonuclease-like RecB superfamily
LQAVADALAQELGRAVMMGELEAGLYADLAENQIMVNFEVPALPTPS